MSAQRAMLSDVGDHTDTAPRATRSGASRALLDDGAGESRTARPAMRALAAPVTFTVVRTRYASPTDKKRSRRRMTTVLAPLGIAAIIASAGFGAADYSFAAGDANTTPQAALAASDYVASQAAADYSTDPVDISLTTAIDDATSVAPVAAADALQTDAGVKAAAAAQAEAERQAAEKAAAEAAAAKAKAEADAKAAAAAKAAARSTGGQGYSNGTAETQAYAPSVSHGQFIYPVGSFAMTSAFGYRIHPIGGYYELHDGMDLSTRCGTPIHASADGIVTRAGWNGALGNYVQIAHNDGLATGYGHQSRIVVEVGQSVSQGEVIGYVGSTGNSTGCHVHFQALHNGDVFNPRSLVV